MCLVAVELMAASGCAFGRKPYSNDPLIKQNRVMWGDRDKTQPKEEVRDEPSTPPAPNMPLIGTEYVTSPP